jgi:diguanylate cyclase (GGDEF)-like protein
MIEDSDDDAQLLLRLLKKEGYVTDHLRVENREDLSRALSDRSWDLIIADNSLPGFNAQEALKVYKDAELDVPFIIVSGDIDDVSAVAAMKAGAHDYLIKDNLARLLPVIARELDEAKVRMAKRKAEEDLRYHAYHDPLTGLLNRREFERAMSNAVHTARRDLSTHILCYLDLDQFKLVNDTCGHIAGDELLRQLSMLLTQKIRANDTLARIGGDEFGLLLNNCSLEDGQKIITDLQESIEDFRFRWDNVSFHVGCSIGLTAITSDTDNIAEPLSAADVACYAAKELGRNRLHVYQADDKNFVKRRKEMQWISRINEALDENRLALFHQPIFDIRDAKPTLACHEVLLRMADKSGTLILPGAFIPAAERFKLMAQVDRWVVRRLLSSLAQGALSFEMKNDGMLLFINLSGATINDETFLDFVQRQFIEFNIPPEWICFEITESVAITNITNTIPLFTKLRDLGCKFALDDFGSGLSSFGYLKHLPVDFVKIDGGFVQDITSDPIDRAMVEAINKISHVMGLQTIAEFVETKEILEVLRELEVEYAQGYLLGQPTSWLRADAKVIGAPTVPTFR